MWFDSHCHLHLCSEPAPELVERARARGVATLVTIGIDVASSRTAVGLADELDLYCSVGLHPNDATEWNDDVAAELDTLARGQRVVAVGESGLDFYRDSAPPDVQEVVFRHHIDLAGKYDKTLVIHTRASLDAALDVLTAVGPPPRVIFHCWSGDPDQARRALDLGAFISFAGNVSFKNAESLRVAARAVPLDRLLIETDSPYLAPHPLRGSANEPGNVVHVGAAVAAARGDDVGAVAAATTANARRAFRLS